MLDFINDILSKYYTEEELEALKYFEEEEAGYLSTMTVESLFNGADIHYKAKDPNNSKISALMDVRAQKEALRSIVEDRYLLEKGKEGVYKDVLEVIASISKKDFKTHNRELREGAKTYLEKNGDNLDKEERQALESSLKFYVTDNALNCESFFRFCVDYPLSVFFNEDLEEGNTPENLDYIEKINKAIEARVSLWYKKPEKVEAPELPRVNFRFPSMYQQGLTKANLRLFDNRIPLSELQQIEIDVTPKKGGLTTTYYVYVDMTAPELEGTENITEYDESVHNMAISLASANEYGFFTARQLATVLYRGDNPNNSLATPQQVGAVTKSIEKLRHVDITVDWTEHIKLNSKDQLPEDTSYKVRGYMLPVEEHEVIINGQKVEGYRFISEPPLYKYARSVGQIGETPVKMLNVPINLDQQKLVLRDFLLKEIAHILKNTSWNRTITTDRLLGVAGEDPETITRKKRSTLLTAVKDMLEHWKKEKYIKGYKVDLAQKGAIKSFTIDPI